MLARPIRGEFSRTEANETWLDQKGAAGIDMANWYIMFDRIIMPKPIQMTNRAFLKPQISTITSLTIYEIGNMRTPAGTAIEPMVIILTASMLEMSRHAVNRMPKNIKTGEMLFFIIDFLSVGANINTVCT